MAFDFSRSRIGLMPPPMADQGDIGDTTAGINPAMRAEIMRKMAVNRQALMEAIRNPDVQQDPEAHARALSYFSSGADPDASLMNTPGVLRAQAHRQTMQRGQEEAMGTANEAARVHANAVARALSGGSMEPQALGLLSPRALAGTQAERMLPTRQALMGAQTETERARPELLKSESEYYRGRGHFFDAGGNAPAVAARAEAGRTERSDREDRRRSDAGLREARNIANRAGTAYRAAKSSGDPLKMKEENLQAILDQGNQGLQSIEAQLGEIAQRPRFQAALDQIWREEMAEGKAVAAAPASPSRFSRGMDQTARDLGLATPAAPSPTARALQAQAPPSAAPERDPRAYLFRTLPPAGSMPFRPQELQPAPSPRNTPEQQADDQLREQVESSQRFKDAPEGTEFKKKDASGTPRNFIRRGGRAIPAGTR